MPRRLAFGSPLGRPMSLSRIAAAVLVTPAGGHPWWEVMTAAIADFPHQFRVVELFDQDNGWIMMRATAADFSVVGDAVANEGRRRGVVDLTSGWLPDDGTGKPDDRNVELWIRKPQ